MSVLITTANYPDELFRINSFFNGVGQGSVRYTSPTTIVLSTSDLNRVVLTGYGFQYDRDQENPWIAGTITSIALWDSAYERKVAEISGLSIALGEIGPMFGVDMYSEIGLISHLFSGSDVLIGSASRDSFYGYDGDDNISSGAGDDDVTPGSGNDVVNGGAGYDLVSYWNYEVVGGDENSLGARIDLRQRDIFDPWGGMDRLISIEGLEGTYYADNLVGNNLENTLFGLSGNDQIYGLAGNDFLSGGEGADTLDGGEGFDTLSYVDYAGPGAIVADLAAGWVRDQWGRTDTVVSIEGIRGTGNSDTLNGSSRDEIFHGMGGDDVIAGGAGADTISYSVDKTRGGLGGVRVDLVSGVALDGFGGTDRFTDIESVYGGQFGDRIYGSAGTNTLRGNLGSDVLSARAGNDWLYGGDGNDTLTGGTGRDGFVFDSAPKKKGNLDRVIGYSVKNDTIYLDDAAFAKLKRGWLKDSAFHTGSKAHDKSDRIIYDKKAGALYYDADGIGGVAQIKFATLTKNLKMTNSDFSVY
ncbi:calcium-binding protein [Microvirga splendida]|uniref:Calcium-binding protein n=1 Tax=Microvirga splendida TaxID=2795727 RepID=A0ABS0XXV6_9HYPH|nr:calcium-binding protein [Microvirga splendida]MBJ6124873.1 calcium-binding protein [Microvirga splendida]